MKRSVSLPHGGKAIDKGMVEITLGDQIKTLFSFVPNLQASEIGMMRYHGTIKDIFSFASEQEGNAELRACHQPELLKDSQFLSRFG
ncbi:hypothetical protein [Agrobacterium vitis]|uniref:hypothetical protein n=1 Tax=Agrobacterium vitis TaxID=373 RepID=UPI003D2854EE